jgi:AraC-like DNA-binding protein
MLYQWIISLPMMICLFWFIFFAVRAWFGEDEPRVKYTILLFYFASTVLYVNHWLFFSDSFQLSPFNYQLSIVNYQLSTYTYLLANLSVYPLYYMYLRALTRTKYTWDNFVLFVPTVLMAVFFPINTHYEWLAEETLHTFDRFFFAIQVIWVWICGFRLLNATQQRMDNTYADNRSYLLQPTHTLLVLLGITAVVSTLQNMLGRELFDGSQWVYIPAMLMSILLFSIGYVAAHTSLPVETVAPEETHEQDRATTEETDELMHKIATAMREQRLFADSHFTVQDLASAVGSNRTYISNCINRRTGLSFSQYVARYRVEYAQTILLDPQYTDDHDALAHAIALSGFSSDQAFFRIFKEVTGLTPLQFRQQNR